MNPVQHTHSWIHILLCHYIITPYIYIYIYTHTHIYTYTYLLIYQSPSWKASRFKDSQELPRILWNPHVHYRNHKCPTPIPILGQLNSVHTPTPYHFLKIPLSIILPSTPGSPQWSLSLRFPHQNPVHVSPLPHTCYMLRPSHSSRYVYIYRVSQEERTKLRECVPYVKLYRYNPKHLYPKLNGYGDNGQRKVWTSCISRSIRLPLNREPHLPVVIWLLAERTLASFTAD